MASAWFVLLSLMLCAYAILDGFDLGVGAIYLGAARTNEERRSCMRAIGPLWNGNEVWLIAAGGSLFFSFPRVYAVSFSGFYLALTLVLWLLILRGISLEFRSQTPDPLWTTFWDAGFVGGSALLALILGVALGNLVRGLPLNGTGLFQGSFGLMLGWYQLLVGVLSLTTLSLHGANYLCLKTEGTVRDRARRLSAPLSWSVLALAALVSLSSVVERPGLLHNFVRWPAGIILPAAAVASLAGTVVFIRRGNDRLAFVSGAALIAGLLATAAFSLYPELLHSTVASEYSLTVANAASAESTLRLGFLLIGSALVLAAVCQVYVYRQFSGKVGVSDPHGGY